MDLSILFSDLQILLAERAFIEQLQQHDAGEIEYALEEFRRLTERGDVFTRGCMQGKNQSLSKEGKALLRQILELLDERGIFRFGCGEGDMLGALAKVLLFHCLCSIYGFVVDCPLMLEQGTQIFQVIMALDEGEVPDRRAFDAAVEEAQSIFLEAQTLLDSGHSLSATEEESDDSTFDSEEWTPDVTEWQPPTADDEVRKPEAAEDEAWYEDAVFLELRSRFERTAQFFAAVIYPQ
jgi:hypothetical protein